MSDSPIKFVQVRCPNCNAVMNLENERSSAFCSYCGTQIIVHRENEQIYRTIDEAEIRKAEINRELQMKKAEIDRDTRIKELEADKKKSGCFRTALKFLIIAILAYFAFQAIAFFIAKVF